MIFLTGNEQVEKMNRERHVVFKERKELRSWNLPLGTYQTLRNCEIGKDPFCGNEKATPKHHIHLVWRIGTEQYFAVHGYRDELFPEFFTASSEHRYSPVVKSELKKAVLE